MKRDGPLLVAGLVLLVFEDERWPGEDDGRGEGDVGEVIGTGDNAEEQDGVMNPVDWVDESEVESSSGESNFERFFDALEAEFGALPPNDGSS